MDTAVVAALIALGGTGFGGGVTALVARRQQDFAADNERQRRIDDAARFEAEREREADRFQDEREREADRIRQEHAHERELALAEYERESRVAARLLLADIREATNRLRRTRTKFWSSRFALPMVSWYERREAVAREIDKAGWASVSSFYRSLSICHLQAEAARDKAGCDRPPVTDFNRRQIDLALRKSEAAKRALMAFSGDHDEAEDDDEGPDAP